MIGDILQTLLRLLFWGFVAICGFIFLVSLVVASAVLLAFWGARMLWARLTGRPVQPFGGIRFFDLRSQMARFAQRAGAHAPSAASHAPRPTEGTGLEDVTDVEIKSEIPHHGKPPSTGA